jgi:hypothetical protein
VREKSNLPHPPTPSPIKGEGERIQIPRQFLHASDAKTYNPASWQFAHEKIGNAELAASTGTCGGRSRLVKRLARGLLYWFNVRATRPARDTGDRSPAVLEQMRGPGGSNQPAPGSPTRPAPPELRRFPTALRGPFPHSLLPYPAKPQFSSRPPTPGGRLSFLASQDTKPLARHF